MTTPVLPHPGPPAGQPPASTGEPRELPDARRLATCADAHPTATPAGRDAPQPAAAPGLPDIPSVPAGARLRALALRRPRLVLVAFCLALWLPGLWSLPPGDRDESRFVQATRQMTESGDYVRILNGTQARNRKPIGIYWLQAPFALAARNLGIDGANPVWPYRLPSVLGALAAVLATFELGALAGRTGGGRDPQSGLLAGMLLASCTVLVVEAHIAKTDASLLGATTLAMTVLGRAYLRRDDPPGPRGAALFWVAMAAGVLLKGPITPMVAGLAAATLWLWDGRAGRGGPGWLRALRPAWGMALLALLVLPWFVAIGLATHGAFLRDAVGGDLAGKLHGGDDSHGALPGLHLLLLPLLSFPATIAVLCGLATAWRARSEARFRFLVAWVVPSWLVFELVPTKLPHYTLPLYPALCLGGAAALLSPASVPRWLRRLAVGCFALAAVLLGLGAASLPLVLARLLHQGAGDTWWRGLPALAASLLVAFLALCPAAPGPSLRLPGERLSSRPWFANRRDRRRAGQPHFLPERPGARPPAGPGRPEVAPSMARLGGGARVDALRGTVLAVAASPLLFAAVLLVELPWLPGLWVSPQAVSLLRARWPGWNPDGTGLGSVGFAEPSLMFLAGTRLDDLPDAAAGAQALAAGRLSAVLVSDRDDRAFLADARMAGLLPRALGRIEGFNYSRGRAVGLTLYVR